MVYFVVGVTGTELAVSVVSVDIAGAVVEEVVVPLAGAVDTAVGVMLAHLAGVEVAEADIAAGVGIVADTAAEKAYPVEKVVVGTVVVEGLAELVEVMRAFGFGILGLVVHLPDEDNVSSPSHHHLDLEAVVESYLRPDSYHLNGILAADSGIGPGSEHFPAELHSGIETGPVIAVVPLVHLMGVESSTVPPNQSHFQSFVAVVGYGQLAHSRLGASCAKSLLHRLLSHLKLH